MKFECMDEEEAIENQIDESARRQLQRLKRTQNPPSYFRVIIHIAGNEPSEP